MPRPCPVTVLLAWLTFAGCTAEAQESPRAAAARCTVDLSVSGQMKDVVSNALMRGLGVPEADVAAFLQNAETRFGTGEALLKAAARRFELKAATLAAEVERFRHCNCEHEGGVDPVPPGTDGAPDSGGPAELSRFAQGVALHVVLHELGHALIREFDLPVLGNEETVADAFATHYLTGHLSDRAVDALAARVTSLMIEAREVPRADWTVRGEHDNDARRAHQIAALAVSADPEKYAPIAAIVGMTDRDVRRARDYGSEVHRSWRRLLAPLRMPAGLASNEARLTVDAGSAFAAQLRDGAFAKELRGILRSFDWHSQVTIRFAAGEGGGGWSRSKRTITVHDGYLRRFVKQGRIAASAGTSEPGAGSGK